MATDVTVARLAELIRENQPCVVLTGAGVSTESGVPDFRSPTGMWAEFDPLEYATLGAFRDDPQKVWRFYAPRFGMLTAAEPNRAHLALAELERVGLVRAIVTQNIDMLHERAGSQNMIEVHGSIRTSSCPSCGARHPLVEVVPLIEAGDGAPECPSCGAILKPDVVFFDELLPPGAMERATELAERARLMLVVGSGLEVYPVAGLPQVTLDAGGQVAVVNQTPTWVDDRAALVLRDRAGYVLAATAGALTPSGDTEGHGYALSDVATAAETTREERIEAQLKETPAKPGVYLFRDAKDAVLYVGKAKSLRSRVRSYFRGGDARLGLDRLIERVERIEVIVTQTEVEAFHLEQNLIKRHRPTFNVRLRDDKSYPYIAVTVEDEYPRVMFTRERHRRGVVYFGPYASAKKVRETLDVLNRVFPYRPCEGPQPGRHSGIPCLDYHIDRCLAPCVGYVSKEDYRAIVDRVIEFLMGETRPVLRELDEKMRAAAERQDFEEAARYRNRLQSVRHLAERQAADKRAIGTVDVIGLAASGQTAAVQVFPLRDGRLVDRHTFYLDNEASEDIPQLLESFCLEYYGSAPAIPPLIVVPPEAGTTEALAEYLSELRGSSVEVRAARRGEKRRLLDLAQQNAELALESDSAHREQKRLRRIEALEELRECVNLESLPLRIECFDISNIQGESPVGSMVVFQDAVPKKAHYRKFGIKGVEGQDDFAMMAEVISRRFARAKEVTADRYDEGFAAIPNLVVIDGGKGQLSAALAAMQTHDLPRVAVIALAKREEEVFVPGRSEPVVLSRDSAGLQLLQRIRDEAHRFALGFHRKRRDAKARESILDALPGVGPARRRALIQHFGSPERLLAASREELEGVPGVPAKTGRQIYAALHRTGRA